LAGFSWKRCTQGAVRRLAKKKKGGGEEPKAPLRAEKEEEETSLLFRVQSARRCAIKKKKKDSVLSPRRTAQGEVPRKGKPGLMGRREEDGRSWWSKKRSIDFQAQHQVGRTFREGGEAHSSMTCTAAGMGKRRKFPFHRQEKKGIGIIYSAARRRTSTPSFTVECVRSPQRKRPKGKG